MFFCLVPISFSLQNHVALPCWRLTPFQFLWEKLYVHTHVNTRTLSNQLFALVYKTLVFVFILVMHSSLSLRLCLVTQLLGNIRFAVSPPAILHGTGSYTQCRQVCLVSIAFDFTQQIVAGAT